jgi:hypothetical protein
MQQARRTRHGNISALTLTQRRNTPTQQAPKYPKETNKQPATKQPAACQHNTCTRLSASKTCVQVLRHHHRKCEFQCTCGDVQRGIKATRCGIGDRRKGCAVCMPHFQRWKLVNLAWRLTEDVCDALPTPRSRTDTLMAAAT